jgi:hypothetical protein
MRTIAFVVAATGWIAVVTLAPAQTYTHYECADGASFELALYPETKAAFLQVDGKSLRLPKRVSLTGQRFAQNGVTFSMKSSGVATIRRAGKTSQCKVN